VITAPASLADLASHGAPALAPYIGRQRPPETPLEWLGIAVTRLPDLAARARTRDEVISPLRPRVAELHGPLVDALAAEIAAVAALTNRALDCHLGRHAVETRREDDVEGYAALLVDAHRGATRRAEFLLGGSASFLGGAIEAAGALAEAELTAARSRRWDRAAPERLVKERAEQVYSALVNALGGLLAYARLTAEDAVRRT
jgi:hypothetical protein